jgi:VanZ family protein
LRSLKTCSRVAWALLAAVIILGSMGDWTPGGPGIWAPTLIVAQDVAANVLLYLPFGALGVLATRNHYPRHWLRLVARITGLAILFSAANEALQLYTSDRVASVTDVVSATVGSFAGGALISAWRPAPFASGARRARHRPS